MFLSENIMAVSEFCKVPKGLFIDIFVVRERLSIERVIVFIFKRKYLGK